MDYAAESKVGRIFYNGQTVVTIFITSKEISFPQPSNPIKRDNSSDEVIVATTVIQKNHKAVVLIFYWMRTWLNNMIYSYNRNQEVKHGGLIHIISSTI